MASSPSGAKQRRSSIPARNGSADFLGCDMAAMGCAGVRHDVHSTTLTSKDGGRSKCQHPMACSAGAQSA